MKVTKKGTESNFFPEPEKKEKKARTLKKIPLKPTSKAEPTEKIKIDKPVKQVKRDREGLEEVSRKVLKNENSAVFVEVDPNSPDNTLDSLLHAIDDKEKARKNDQYVGLFYTTTGKFKIQYFTLDQVDASYFEAQLKTVEQLHKLLQSTKNEINKETLIQLLVKEQYNQLERTLKLILLNIDPSRAIFIKNHFQAINSQLEITDKYLSTIRRTPEMTKAFQQAIDFTRNLRDRVYTELSIHLPLVRVKDEGFLSQVVLSKTTDSLSALLASKDALLDVLQHNPKIIAQHIPNNPELFDIPEVHEQFKNDYEVIFKTVRNNPLIYQKVSERLKADKEKYKAIVREALIATTFLKYPEEIVKHKDEIHKEAQKLFPDPGTDNKTLKKYEPYDEKQYKLYIEDFLNPNASYTVLCHALDIVQNTSVSDSSMNKNGNVSNKWIALSAMKESGRLSPFRILNYFNRLNNDLQNDKDIALKVLPVNPNIFYGLSEELQNELEPVFNSKEMVLIRINQGYNYFDDLSEVLQNDRDVALALVQQNGWILEQLSEKLKNDKKIVLAAVRQNPYIFDFLSDELKQDEEIQSARETSKLHFKQTRFTDGEEFVGF